MMITAPVLRSSLISVVPFIPGPAVVVAGPQAGPFPSLCVTFLTWLAWWMFSLCALVESGVERVDILTYWWIPACSSESWSSLTSQT